MVIGRFLAPVHSLGPGERVCLWMKGCGKKCPGCISPELWSKEGRDIPEPLLAKMVLQIAEKGKYHALTISGGDPMEQAVSLYRFLLLVREQFDDILVYTGFTQEEILGGCAGEYGIKCLELIDVLIDGRYVMEKNTEDCVLRGSSNQNILFLNEKVKENYLDYMSRGRILENFVHDGETIITGILNNDNC